MTGVAAGAGANAGAMGVKAGAPGTMGMKEAGAMGVNAGAFVDVTALS
jgi:hypothetical protein